VLRSRVARSWGEYGSGGELRCPTRFEPCKGSRQGRSLAVLGCAGRGGSGGGGPGARRAQCAFKQAVRRTDLLQSGLQSGSTERRPVRTTRTYHRTQNFIILIRDAQIVRSLGTPKAVEGHKGYRTGGRTGGRTSGSRRLTAVRSRVVTARMLMGIVRLQVLSLTRSSSVGIKFRSFRVITLGYQGVINAHPAW